METVENACCSDNNPTKNNNTKSQLDTPTDNNIHLVLEVETMTKDFQKTRISVSNNTESITIPSEELCADDDDDDDENDYDEISVHSNDSSGDGVWSGNSSLNGSISSDSTRSRTFSIYCVEEGDDDCSSISTVSQFIREAEEEILDDSSSCSYVSVSEDDSELDNSERKASRRQDHQEDEFLEEVLDEDDNGSDFTGDDSDYDEVSYDEDLEYDDEYGDDEYGEPDEGVVVDTLAESARSLLDSGRSQLSNTEIVLEKTPRSNKLRVFSNVNSRQSHNAQMAMFMKNISDTKKTVGILDDDELVEVVEEEVDDQDVEVIEEDFVEEIVDETEFDEDHDFIYEVVPPTPKKRTKCVSPKPTLKNSPKPPSRSPKMKRKEIERQRRLSLLSV